MKIKKYDYPIGLQIELTGRCNLKCHHCYNSSGEAGILDLKNNEWLEFIKRYLDTTLIPQINFTGGECLLRKKLLMKIINEISRKDTNTKIGILTNGYYVDDYFIDLLKEVPNPIFFFIFLDGANKKEHEAVRRIRGSWEKAIDACLRITNAGFPLKIASVVTERNQNDIQDIFDLTLLLGAESLGVGPVVPLGRAIEDKESLVLDTHSINKIIDNLTELKKLYNQYFTTNISSPLNSNYYAKVLEVGQNWLMIDNRGNVKVDSRLPFFVGNILESSIENIWETVCSSNINYNLHTMLDDAIKTGNTINNTRKINI